MIFLCFEQHLNIKKTGIKIANDETIECIKKQDQAGFCLNPTPDFSLIKLHLPVCVFLRSSV